MASIKQMEHANNHCDTYTIQNMNSEEISCAIREARTFCGTMDKWLVEKKLTLTDIEKRTNISVENLKRYKSEKRTPSREAVIMISAALMLSKDERNSFLEDSMHVKMKPTRSFDTIVDKYYEEIVEEFKKGMAPESMECIKQMNLELKKYRDSKEYMSREYNGNMLFV